MADTARQYKFQLGVESVYADGGSSFTDLPVAYTGIPELDLKKFEVPVYNGSLAQQKTYYSPQVYTVPLSFYLKGSGTAGTAPELDKVFRAAGLQATNTPVTSQTYKPRDTGHESFGAKVNLNGVEYALSGARITKLSIPMKGGEPVTVTGELKGLYNAPTGVAYSAPTFADVLIAPPVCYSSALTIAGTSYVIPEFTINLEYDFDVIPSINAANNGIAEIAFSGRKYGGEFLVQRAAGNDIEFWTALTASTELAVLQTSFGSAGNKVDFDFANMQLTSVKPEYAYNQQFSRVQFQMNYNATAASEFQLKFT